MPKLIDLTGKVFERWEVIQRAESRKGNTFYLCKCECGTMREVNARSLMHGLSKSCGCLHNELLSERSKTHGKSKARIYRIWAQMIQRTTNSNQKDYKDYGVRGIAVCEEWKNSFEAFEKWSYQNGYSEKLTIDRKNNEKGYEPENCQWVSMKEQSRNTRKNHYITFQGKTKTIADWAAETGIKRNKISERINRYGWSVERALTTK